MDQQRSHLYRSTNTCAKRTMHAKAAMYDATAAVYESIFRMSYCADVAQN